MAEVDVPTSMTTAMDDIGDGIRGLRIAFVNVFSITHPGGSWTLIDAGVPMSASLIRSWAEKNFSTPPLAIVLTHGHFDHVSAAGELAEHWNVPIYAHSLEAPYLTGQKEYPPPDPGVGGGLMSLLSPMYPKGPVNLGSRLEIITPQADGSEINVLPQWKVLHTPGHTPGHISFFRPSDRALIVGDAFCTTKPESFFDAAIFQSAELHGPPAYFTADPVAAARSIQRLAALRPRILVPGHGRPVAGQDVDARLFDLAAQFHAEGDRTAGAA